jgi:sigma-B regulation protein RsbQ
MVDYDLWAAGFGSFVVGNPEHPEAASEFVSSLRALGPEVAGVMLRAALLGDFREYMPYVSCPTLVLQSRDDPAVPIDAARWLADAIPDAQFGSLRATGHHPHLVDPVEVADRVAEFLLSPS